MQEEKIRRSPMFYVGDKYRLIKEIRQYFPKNIDTLIEPFVGGGSVFLNTHANHYLINDIDGYVYKIHKFLISYSLRSDFFKQALGIINKYALSKSFVEDIVPNSLRKQYNKTYYAKFNKTSYERLKQDFNTSEEKDILSLYILLIYGFNRILRFNSKGEFNIPTGNVDFNKNVETALKEYFDFVKDKNIRLENKDFRLLLQEHDFKENDFVYLDPPYLITFSEYNKIWNENTEIELLSILDELNKRGIKFAISNVTTYKDKTNKIFTKWMKKYTVVSIKSNYISYHDNTKKKFEEVLVFNY